MATQPQGRFATWVSKSTPRDPLLPLTHTTDGYYFRDIASSRQLKRTMCPTFKEPLVYLFYGRPAYRPSATDKATSLNAFCLISFILRPNGLPPPKRVFPFDSGAMHNGLFADFMHPAMISGNFELETNIAQAQRIVEIFYGANERYYMGRPRSGLAIPALEFEAQCYYALIQDVGKHDADDRKCTIEVQFAIDLNLGPNDVMAVIAPEFFWDDKEISDFVGGYLGAEPLSYDCYHAQPAEDTRAIMQVARHFLVQKGLLT